MGWAGGCNVKSGPRWLRQDLSAMQETWVQSLGWEDALEKGMATHSSILAWRIPWTEEPGSYSPWGCKELDMREQLMLPFPIRKGLWRRWDLITELKEPCDCQNRVLQREGTAIVKALKEGMPLKECLGSS